MAVASFSSCGSAAAGSSAAAAARLRLRWEGGVAVDDGMVVDRNETPFAKDDCSCRASREGTCRA